MSLLSNYSLQSNKLLFSHRQPLPIREHRLWRRRRLKLNRRSTFRNQAGPFGTSSLENLFHNLVSQFPSVNSLDLIAPALGFASGAALYLSRLKSDKKSGISDVGEWILFTSPTPFNRFVVLRCPSISFEGNELLEDVNEKLVKEDRHFVKLSRGRIQVRDDLSEKESELEYQRVCVGTDDGGVISLDWPASLDLREEHGLDTTVLLVPGTAEGSMDRSVQSFVLECLKRGCFPVVMNPRGCAGSPLTTARLFTAADSDDVCTAIQFINKARPWTTLMGVGWGYGANMLTKYLAEVGEKTPLTAATCIDNPFDLEEATRSSLYHIAINQKLTGGLIDILRSNKELFHGRTKGFDVEKALLAKSVRDFEKAISMVFYGFDAIEDFYSESSTRDVIGNVKIPLLFIQNDDGTVPMFSIPRSLIAENPYTSLLLCSSSPSRVISGGRSVISWCQHCTIEWLMAVELGLLKGRHPLLQDVDITINPSKGLAHVEGTPSDKVGRANKLLHLTESNTLNGYRVDPINKIQEEGDNAVSLQMRRNLELEEAGLQQVDNGAVQQTNYTDTESLKDDEVSLVDNERGQVLQTAQVVMNMLDVTMPDTLAEEQKKKVLTAVGQGETLMKALQDAVPEDVRGKLTTAVSGILHSRGSNLNVDGLVRIGHVQNVSSGLKSNNIHEKAGDISSEESLHKGPSDHNDRANNLGVGSDNNHPVMDQPSEGLESELLISEKSQKSASLGQAQSTSSDGNDEFFKGNDSQCPDPSQNGSVTNSKEYQYEVEHDGGMDGLDMKEEKNIQNIEERTSDSTDQKTTSSSVMEDDSLLPHGLSSEAQLQENDNQKREDENSQPVLNLNKSFPSDSNPPTFNVSEAFDALAGMDDSTQVAVNNVFGVIENMINHLEEGYDNQSELKGRNELQEKKTNSVSEAHHIKNDYKLEKKENKTNELSLQPDSSHDSPAYDNPDNQMDSHMEAINGVVEEKPTQNSNSFIENGTTCSYGNNIAKLMGKKQDETKEHLVASRLLVENSDRGRHVNCAPLYIGTNPYGESFYNDQFRRYPLSKLPNSKSLDIDTTTALLLDYIPKDGKWTLLEQPGNAGDSNHYTRGVERKFQVCSPAKANDTDQIIEPPYVILDTEKQQKKPVGESQIVERRNGKDKIEDYGLEELMLFARNNVLDSLKVEVSRRLSAVDMKEMESDLARDMEQIANAVFLAVQYDTEHASFHIEDASEKVGIRHRDRILKAISFAAHNTTCLRRVLPFGVIVGSSLAALRKVYSETEMNDGVQSKQTLNLDQVKIDGLETHGQVCETEVNHMPPEKADQNSCLDISTDMEKAVSKNLKNENVMVGAVTAALGASALFSHQQDPCKDDESGGTSSIPGKVTVNHQKGPENLEAVSEKYQSNIVSSLAEKAMSVAGPVVPTKEDGEVDQERLVAMLADWGQKGGMLRLVGKLALLWGGIRGAMSLTDRLILFLRIAERPLLQRILSFICMVLVLWSPVVVPLFPTLVQGWAAHNASRFAELACIVGLYTAIMILVMLWGKRIRGYDNPLEQYGLDFAPPSKIQNFVKAFIGGAMLVLSIQSVNAVLGCVSLSWPSSLPYSSLVSVASLKAYGKMLLLAGQGILTATAIAIVEELLFRSWLPAEIATDLGYQRGIILSGLAFSLLQRSPQAIPGLWLLSLGLAGARQRSQGSLSIPIGLRSGIMTVSFILQMGGFVTYKHNLPFWVAGTHPFQPFSGIVGLAFSLILAVVFYPSQSLRSKKITRSIRD